MISELRALRAAFPTLLSVGAMAAFVVVTLSVATQRDPIFQDELINTARTFVGFSSWAANVLDYSLRPLYRLLNMTWASLFGIDMRSLWLGTTLVAIAIAVVLQRLGAYVGGSLLAAAAPLFLLSSPLYIPVGLAAMPHLPSAIFTILSLGCLLVWQMGGPDTFAARRAIWLVSAAFFLAALALLTHPSQLAFVVALFMVVGVVVIVGFIRDDLRLGVHTRNALFPAAAGAAIFFGIIALVEITYRWLAADVANDRLLPGHTYSLINLWVGTIYEFDKSLASYTKPASFYATYLFSKHRAFTLVSLGVVTAALGTLVLRWRKGKLAESDLAFFLPALLTFLWIAVASLTKMKEARVLVGVTPLAVASNVVLIAYILRSVVAERFRPAIGVLIVALAGGWAASAVSSQRVALQRQAAANYDRAGAPYRILRGLPKGAVGFIDIGSNDTKSYRNCRYFANATGRPLRDLRQKNGTVQGDEKFKAEARAVGVRFLCSRTGTPEQLGSESAKFWSEAQGFQLLYAAKRGYAFWARLPLSETP